MADMTPQRFEQAKDDTTAHAREAMEHLYQALLNVPPFTLKDGTPVQVEAYDPPEINDAGEMQCGVDVMLPNGHLEFTLRNSGWGRSFADGIETARAKREAGNRGRR